MENIKFNVIIPTRERADTLQHCLRSVVSQRYENLNIVVSDNFSSDNTKDIVDSFGDSRIKYINTGKRVGMSQNFEFGLSCVTDGWVSYLGDDDGLMPNALSIIREIAESHAVEAIASHWCYYHWPNSGVADWMYIPLEDGIEFRDGREGLARLMNGSAAYTELPMLYTSGFVHINLINRARGKNGLFFQSCIPDVYSAIALGSIVGKYIYLKKPVAVAGISRNSNGASQLGYTSNSKPKEAFYSEENIPFDPRLGDFRKIESISLLTYECYLKSDFLHKNFLSISIEDQLSLALIKSKGSTNELLINDCVSEICKINNIQFIDQKIKAGVSENMLQHKKPFIYRVIRKIKKILKTAYSNFFLSNYENKTNVMPVNVTISNPSEIFGVTNVFEAGIAARAYHDGVQRKFSN